MDATLQEHVLRIMMCYWVQSAELELNAFRYKHESLWHY